MKDEKLRRLASYMLNLSPMGEGVCSGGRQYSLRGSKVILWRCAMRNPPRTHFSTPMLCKTVLRVFSLLSYEARSEPRSTAAVTEGIFQTFQRACEG